MDKAVVVDGKIEARPMLTLTTTIDHATLMVRGGSHGQDPQGDRRGSELARGCSRCVRCRKAFTRIGYFHVLHVVPDFGRQDS
ncbi:hypothetical protein GQ600_1214 [Phytophthora cactorum]|nr:hypothetical protein GQ600_1214 [Phytophthora cactorum]